MTVIVSYVFPWVRVDQNKAEDLRCFLNDQNQKWLKAAAPCWSYRIPTKSSFLSIKRGTGQHFYKDIDSDDKPYRMICSLLPKQLTMP